MPTTADPFAQGLQRAPRTGTFDVIRAKCRGHSVLQLLQGAPEEFPARLELRPEAEEPEAIVAGYVESGDDLVE